MKYVASFFLVILPFSLLAQDPVPTDQLLKQSEQRQIIIDKQLNPQLEEKARVVTSPISKQIEDQSSVCFPVNKLQLTILNGIALSPRFSAFVGDALTTAGIRYKKNDDFQYTLLPDAGQSPCLSAVAVQNLNTDIQNRLISEGWVTSRVLAPDQSLSDEQLILSLSEGVLTHIYVDTKGSDRTHASRANTWTAFPIKKGEPLNLRDLEQGLENLRRLPTASAEISIIPGQEPSTSDVEVKWSQRSFPIRVSISVDDSGSKSTGKNLSTLGLAWDNLLRLNDILSASYTQNLTSGTKTQNPQGGSDHGETYSYALNYSFPLGYWLIDAGVSHYFYDQVTAGVNRNYHYTGESDQASANLSRVLYRDNQHKLRASVGVWRKVAKSFIDDAEIDVQRRRTAGWKVSLSQRSYFKSGVFSGTLGYKRGTRAFGAMPAPEELFNEGTAKSQIWVVDFDWQMPFGLGNTKFNSQTSFHGQLNKVKLTPQDKISIGGRYTVRGFSGLKSLSADRGWYVRENLAWLYSDSHQLYLGLDVGRVSGESAKALPEQTLSGTVLGLKGQHKYYGNWHYDVFLGTQLKNPDDFENDKIVSGFNIGYDY